MSTCLKIRCAWLLLPAVTILPHVVPAQSNLILLISAAGEHVGGGLTYYTTNQSDIGMSGTAATVSVGAFGFTMTLDAPGQAKLTVGGYSNAVQYPANGNSPGLSVFGNGRNCTNVCGSFQIFELETNASGNLTRFWATFLQHCECSTSPPLTGEIRCNSLLAPPGPLARTLLVPDDFPTIQSAINDINPLAVDTVLVGPGLYQESVQIGTGSVHLVSANGPAVTVIMAPSGQPSVYFGVHYQSGNPDALVTGFTFSNSTYGVSVAGAFSPSIISNLFVNCGGGVDCNGGSIDWPGSAIIRGNVITNCSGTAVQFSWTAEPVLEGNRLEGNGAGVGMWQAGSPLIRNNIIRGNRGDGFTMWNYCDPNIIQNLIVENAGNGIKWLVPLGGRGPYVVNNTIVENGGAGISADGYDGAAQIINNIVVGNPAIWVGNFNDITPPVIKFNNVYSRTGVAYSGLIADLTGTAGNISGDPFFTCQPGEDFHLLSGSLCIDAGTNGAPFLPATDFDGRPRVLAGATNGSARVDLGAFEFEASNPPAACLFLFCPVDILVILAPGQNSSVISYPSAFATPGANVTYSSESGSVFPAGDTAVNVTADYGTNVMNCAFGVSLLTIDDFGRGLNATNLAWSTGGDALWFVENSVTKDGLAAAQSGAISSNQTSTLQTIVSGPGQLNFWWKISSQTNHGLLSLEINGSQEAAISGEIDWQLHTVYLGSGPQTIQWPYGKDASPAAGQDSAWLDLVSFTSGTTAPILVSQPASVSQAPGLSAGFSVGAVGTPPLAFQWSFNGENLPGATNTSLVVTNVQVGDVGVYSVLVTNVAGATNSNNAALVLAEVVAWGGDSYGQADVPVSLSNVLAVAGGWHHSVALRNDGTVVAWGANNQGQTNIPSGLSNVVGIASRSGNFSMALKADGTVVVWGQNSFNQTNVPAGLSNVVAIAAGEVHCLALKADGTITSWGYYTAVPAGLSNVVAIAAGNSGSLALESDGTVTSWGQPVAPGGLSNITAVAVGSQHGLALNADGTVVVWGDNTYGQTNVPAGLSNVVAIAAGDYHCYALKADGTVTSWGKYYNGTSYVPAAVLAGLSNVVAIAAGSDHDLALLSHGPAVLQSTALGPSWSGNAFSLSIPTQSGHTYDLEYRDAWDTSPWVALPLAAGTGRTNTLTDPSATGAQRFYRIRRW